MPILKKAKSMHFFIFARDFQRTGKQAYLSAKFRRRTVFLLAPYMPIV